MKAILAKAGPYRVEQIPCPHPNDNVNMAAPPAGIMHTTEGGWSSALSVFRQHYAPHFMVGRNRVAQLIPLGKMAAAVEHPPGFPETNRVARVQIEVVGYSRDTPYQFDRETFEPLAELMAALEEQAGIPLVRPFPDEMPAKPWATRSFTRRLAGKWGRVGGWYGHVEIPGNTHWDPGYLKWGDLIKAAQAKSIHEPEHVYHLKLRDDHGKEYEWNNVRYPGSVLKNFGLVDHNIVQGWIERSG